MFNNSNALREAINSKSIDLDELIKVLKKSKKFKEWISGKDPEEDLIRTYYSDITKETIVDKLPRKECKVDDIYWIRFTGR